MKYLSLILGLMMASAIMSMGQPKTIKTKETLPREKIALQTDRTLYVAGEKVWFRADYFAQSYHPKQPLSKVLYLELFNSKEEPVVQKKVAIHRGKATGSFNLPEEATSGTYLLRAYTKYQRNFPSEAFEQHKLVVLNPDKPPQSTPQASDSVDIQLAFTGGRLIRGMETEVAFLLDQYILENQQAIFLTQSDSQIIDSLKTWSNGLGSFRFTPADTLHHQLMAVMNNGDTLTKPLPPPSPSGRLVNTRVDSHHLTYSLRMVSNSKTTQTANYRLAVLTPDLEMLVEKSLNTERPG